MIGCICSMLSVGANGVLAQSAVEYPVNQTLPEIYFDQAELYMQAADQNKAYKIYKKIYKKYPDAPEAADAVKRMGDIELERKDYDDAFKYYAEALDKYPLRSDYAQIVEILFKLGTDLISDVKKSGEPRKSSLKLGVKIFEDLSTRAIDFETASTATYNSGVGNFKLKKYQESLDELEAVADTRRGNIRDNSLYLLCSSYYELALKARYNQIPIDNAMIMLLRYMDQIQNLEFRAKVQQMYLKVLEIKGEYFYSIARFYEKSGHEESAKIYYRKIINEFKGTKAAEKAKKKV